MLTDVGVSVRLNTAGVDAVTVMATVRVIEFETRPVPVADAMIVITQLPIPWAATVLTVGFAPVAEESVQRAELLLLANVTALAPALDVVVVTSGTLPPRATACEDGVTSKVRSAFA
jgi:hypothetical protein